ncbi:MAG: restriction endonuclease [Alphaproteobacteria bacterium]|nr:restriction endonuclease [Alphaproteobacteria bacterium]
MSGLLPADFDALLFEAVRLFWTTKGNKITHSQGGTRSSVLSGKHMDGFTQIFQRVAQHAGLPEASILTRGARLTLPGYFRASKNWDAVVLHEGRLLAALEFKSQVGSFGNNQNNRIEEVVGLGHDFWTARRHGLVEPVARPDGETTEGEPLDIVEDPRPPFLGYLLLLEDTPRSSKEPVSIAAGALGHDPVFTGATYADRYRIMAERLMSERLYNGVGLMMSSQSDGDNGAYWTMSEATAPRALFRSFAAHLLGAVG